MRQPEDMGWYAENGPDGNPVAVHGIKRRMPEGSLEITEGQAKEISASRRANPPGVSAPPQGSARVPSPDLQPILDKLEAQALLIAKHAELHDQHLAAEAQQTQTIAKVQAAVGHLTAGLKDLGQEKQG